MNIRWIRSLFFCCMCIVLSVSAAEPNNKASHNVRRKVSKVTTQSREINANKLDLSVPSDEQNRTAIKLTAPIDKRFPQLLDGEPKDAKDFELGARLIQREWKETNEENKDWRNRFGGAEVEFRFRN